MDSKTTLQELKNPVADFIKERDWNQFHFPKNLSMAIALEAAELMEKFTWIEAKASDDELKEHRQEIEQELADIVILSLAFANRCNIDVSSAVMHKIEEIKKKYPVEKVKGKYLKYTQYK